MTLFGHRLHLGQILLLFLLAGILVLSLRLIGIARQPLPAPPTPASPQLADSELLSRHDIFFPGAIINGSNLPVTALPFSLHGLRADSATGRGSAIIATGDGEQSLYEVGDSLDGEATLAAIADDHVVIEHAGRREALWLDSAGTTPVERFIPVDPHADTDLPDASPPDDSTPDDTRDQPEDNPEQTAKSMPQPHFGDAAAIPVSPPSETP